MESLINYLNIKTREVGHKPSMPELRELIEIDFQEHSRIAEDLRSLYDKTFEFENMQKALKRPQFA